MSSNMFWLGLERMHILTSSANYRLRIEIMQNDGQWFSAEYAEFSIGDESNTQYQLNIDGY